MKMKPFLFFCLLFAMLVIVAAATDQPSNDETVQVDAAELEESKEDSADNYDLDRHGDGGGRHGHGGGWHGGKGGRHSGKGGWHGGKGGWHGGEEGWHGGKAGWHGGGGWHPGGGYYHGGGGGWHGGGSGCRRCCGRRGCWCC